jgi:hypothetical protein
MCWWIHSEKFTSSSQTEGTVKLQIHKFDASAPPALCSHSACSAFVRVKGVQPYAGTPLFSPTPDSADQLPGIQINAFPQKIALAGRFAADSCEVITKDCMTPPESCSTVPKVRPHQTRLEVPTESTVENLVHGKWFESSCVDHDSVCILSVARLPLPSTWL